MTEFLFASRFGAHHSRLHEVEDCGCPAARYGDRPDVESFFHIDEPLIDSLAWLALLDFIDECANDKRTVFAPGLELDPDLWRQIPILPSSISKLTSVEHLLLYGSHLSAIPPEVGEMTALKRFEPYTSDRLHWFPYEITRCTALVDSTVSTRAMYGNRKTYAPFPQLQASIPKGCVPTVCSVCRGPFSEPGPIQCWYSMRLATDTLPLLVHACSRSCVDALPSSPAPDVNYAHLGGFDRKPV